MLKLFKKKTRKSKGFTLIELIVVIAILGILAAIAIPRLAGFQGSANDRTMLTDIKTIETAVATCMTDAPTVATTDLTLNAYDATAGINLDTYLDKDIITKYGATVTLDVNGRVKSGSTCVVNGKTYTYNIAADGTRSVTH